MILGIDFVNFANNKIPFERMKLLKGKAKKKVKYA